MHRTVRCRRTHATARLLTGLERVRPTLILLGEKYITRKETENPVKTARGPPTALRAQVILVGARNDKNISVYVAAQRGKRLFSLRII